MASKHPVRLQALDTFRGIAIAGMLLVNTASLSPELPPWLAHSYWNGCTVADSVFPFFLFIVGVTTAFSLSKYNQNNKPTAAIHWRILRRSLLLFALGVLLNAFLNDSLGVIKLSGVLQRISVAYLVTAAIALYLPRKTQWGVVAFLLIGYWVGYAAFPVPEPVYHPGESHQAEVATFGIMSLFGLMPTIAITLLGYFTGAWLWAETNVKQIRTTAQSLTLVLFGVSYVVLGELWSLLLPINKKLWTSSYALLTVGLALLLFAACYELIEVRGRKHWSQPLQILGFNSIVIFVGSELDIKLLEKTHIGSGPDAPSSYMWLDQHLFLNWSEVATAGVLFAAVVLLLWCLIAYFLYKRRWFIAI